MKTVSYRFFPLVLLSVALLGAVSCGARAPEPRPTAALEEPARFSTQPSPPPTAEPASLDTFALFLDRA